MKNQERIVLKSRQLVEIIKEEGMYLGIFFIIILLILKVVFYKEEIIVIIKIAFSILYLFVLPGYFITLYWKEKIEFKERIILGVVAAASVVGILSYYIGLLGLNVKYHFILPTIIVVLSILVLLLSKKEEKCEEHEAI